RSFSWQNSFCVLPLLFHTSINENINCRVVMSVELSIALLFSSKTIPSASSLKYVLYRWVTAQQPKSHVSVSKRIQRSRIANLIQYTLHSPGSISETNRCTDMVVIFTSGRITCHLANFGTSATACRKAGL